MSISGAFPFREMIILLGLLQSSLLGNEPCKHACNSDLYSLLHHYPFYYLCCCAYFHIIISKLLYHRTIIPTIRRNLTCFYSFQMQLLIYLRFHLISMLFYLVLSLPLSLWCRQFLFINLWIMASVLWDNLQPSRHISSSHITAFVVMAKTIWILIVGYHRSWSSHTLFLLFHLDCF